MQVPTTQGESDVSSPDPGPEPRSEAPALFRLMADRIPGVVWAIDTDLRFTASFGAALRELNLLPNQVVGRTLMILWKRPTRRSPRSPLTGGLQANRLTSDSLVRGCSDPSTVARRSWADHRLSASPATPRKASS
jgi:hypothetical protein